MLELAIGGAIVLPQIDPVAVSIGPLAIRWYALSYIAGIMGAWWLLGRLVQTPGSPMGKRHVDDFITWATLGIILGGRLGFVLFYDLERYLANPADILKVWQGGMSFHGGVIGVSLVILLYCRAQKLSWLRLHDYVAVAVPIGLLFGRLANFVNAELYGRPTDVPWAMVFPTDPTGLPRHPSQLYEAGLEGALLLVILLLLFYRTSVRYRPGFLVGTFILGYGCFRFLVEFVREPDAGLGVLGWGLTMGQTLCVPMILGGLILIGRALGRAAVSPASPGRA